MNESARKTDKPSDQKLVINELNNKIALLTATVGNMGKQFTDLAGIAAYLAKNDAVVENRIQ